MAPSKAKSPIIYTQKDAHPQILEGVRVAVIGYGNQGKAQALNLRDSNVRVIVGNQRDDYKERAQQDGFEVFEIPAAAAQAEIVLLLIPDEILPDVFESQIKPNLNSNAAVVFASGYCVAFNQITAPADVDVLLMAPRMIGAGVRERYLNEEGFYCFVGIQQDASGFARERLLSLTYAISKLQKPAIEVTFKQEAVLDLFNEQAFGPAFGRVLLTSISVLLEQGLPPEAILVEMYMSEEMAYTYRKMAQVGLVKQTLLHSPTSQYGAMSRGLRFMGTGLKDRMKKIYEEIERGDFAKEWQSPFAHLKFKVIRFFAMRQQINQIEGQVRKVLGLSDVDIYESPADIEKDLKNPAIQVELEGFKDGFEF